MKCFCFFLPVFFSVFLCCSASAFDGVLGSTASCHKTCRMTYSLHTYPRELELFACQRGCRLFSICQFVSDAENLNQTKSECDSAGGHDAPNTPALPPDPGKGILGGHDEPGSGVYYHITGPQVELVSQFDLQREAERQGSGKGNKTHTHLVTTCFTCMLISSLLNVNYMVNIMYVSNKVFVYIDYILYIDYVYIIV
ncbi:Transmembrane protein 59 [Bagarius yarrelli]|uniref:Transmembrane protein 59 n=1 Tax=Bagarius yarrelli TaxID=175774 RepID=A0A556VX55_BAGYA|nr:Transmembrane protein 59 [Bagarius yarrelli]